MQVILPLTKLGTITIRIVFQMLIKPAVHVTRMTQGHGYILVSSFLLYFIL